MAMCKSNNTPQPIMSDKSIPYYGKDVSPAENLTRCREFELTYASLMLPQRLPSTVI